MDQPSQPVIPIRAEFRAAADIGANRCSILVPPFDDEDQDGGAEAEIEAMFRAKLMGLRRLPRYERPAALRAAWEWRQAALRALREKRARDRHGRYMLWRQQRLPPREPG